VRSSPADPDPDPADPDPADPDPADPDPDPDPDDPDPELLRRRVPGDVAVERELAPAVRVRVEGLVPGVDVVLVLEVRVEDLGVAEAAEAGLDVAAALVARSSSCSRARTRC
jgi:hypothetical protein